MNPRMNLVTQYGLRRLVFSIVNGYGWFYIEDLVLLYVCHLPSFVHNCVNPCHVYKWRCYCQENVLTHFEGIHSVHLNSFLFTVITMEWWPFWYKLKQQLYLCEKWLESKHVSAIFVTYVSMCMCLCLVHFHLKMKIYFRHSAYHTNASTTCRLLLSSRNPKDGQKH